MLRTPRTTRQPEKSLPSIASAVPKNASAEQEQIITLLQAELEEKNTRISQLENNRMKPFTNSVSSAEDRQTRMEKLKKSDPEKYEELTARREKMREDIQNAFAQKAAGLLDRNTSNLKKEELARYELLLNTLDKSWQLTEQLTNPDTPPEQRKEIRQELQETTKELRPLLTEERERQFYELGRASGYSEDEAKGFVDYINNTLRTTSLPPTGGNRGRNRRPAGKGEQ
jgi:signal recognition particle GTPase